MLLRGAQLATKQSSIDLFEVELAYSHTTIPIYYSCSCFLLAARHKDSIASFFN
jgi:hypothetical protein